MPWIDFSAVKKTVSIEMVLAHYNIRLRKVNEVSLRGQCPLPTHDSQKGSPSFAVNLSKNAWACLSQSCIKGRHGKRGGNQLDLVSCMEGCSVRDAALKLADWFNVLSEGGGASSPAKVCAPNASTTQRVAGRKFEKEVTHAAVGSTENKPLGFALRHIDHSHPYLTARGITPEIAAHFGSGFFGGKGSMHGRIVIPIHNRAGELVAYAGRSIDESEPKYKLPAGFHKALEIFNLHRVLVENPEQRKPVIVVEGVFGALKIHQAGYSRVVALMGSSLSDAQERMLAGFSHVVLIFDGDEAGREATRQIAARLARRTFVKVMNLPDGVQPDKLSSEDIRSILGSV
jgi:DNA primase